MSYCAASDCEHVPKCPYRCYSRPPLDAVGIPEFLTVEMLAEVPRDDSEDTLDYVPVITPEE